MQKLRDLLALFIASLALGAFTFTSPGSPFAEGEAVSHTNMNEIDTALDNLEAVPALTTTATSTLSAEQNIGALTTGLMLNTVAAGSGTVSTYAGATATANQVVTAIGASGTVTSTALTTAYLPSGAALDADSTAVCVSKQYEAPEAGSTLSLYAAHFGTTLLRYRMYLTPTTEAATTTVAIRECTAGQQSCGASDSNYTANSDGASWDTSFSDSAIAVDANVIAVVVLPSDDLSAAALNVDLCYSRQVVQ